LYLIILDNGLKLSPEEGKRMWGRQGWERETSRVQGSTLWNDLIDAIHGDIGLIESEVMMAM
jgi:hypothetical protein